MRLVVAIPDRLATKFGDLLLDLTLALKGLLSWGEQDGNQCRQDGHRATDRNHPALRCTRVEQNTSVRDGVLISGSAVAKYRSLHCAIDPLAVRIDDLGNEGVGEVRENKGLRG